MKNTLCHVLLVLPLPLALPLPAEAECTLCACTVSATGVAFGAYNPLSGAPADSAGNVRISCGGGAGTVGYSIQLGQGAYGAGFSPRRMGSGGNRLNYNLYADPARTAIWGDGSGSTALISGSLDVLAGGSSHDHAVYGRIPARQTSTAAGGYSDTVTLTLIFQ